MSIIPAMRPTMRRRVSRASTYVVTALLVLTVALVADWGKLGQQFANLDVAASMWPDVILIGVVNTVVYTLVGFVFGSVLAVVVAVLKLAGGPLGWLATGYIELFRGIPMLLTLFIFAYGLPIGLGIKPPGGTLTSGLIGLVVVTSAYTAEIIRSGIQAVPPGQVEAARSLGMSSTQTTFWVTLPQGLRIVIPPLTNEFVMLLKDTSLLAVVGLTAGQKELTNFSRDLLSTHSNPTPLIVAAVCYLVITVPLTYVVGRLEKRLDPKR